jgi:hypothetical protein
MKPPRHQYTALTVLSPIRGGHTHGAVHAAGIRAALARLPQGSASPFAAIPTLHFARLVVLDDVRIQGIPAREDHLRSKYLLFTADCDGTAGALALDLARHAGPFVNDVWQHCVAFPGTADPAAFARYLAQCTIPTTFPFGAYVDQSLQDVLRALDAQRRLIAFLRDHQQADPATQQAAFRSFAEEWQRAEVPAPGTI